MRCHRSPLRPLPWILMLCTVLVPGAVASRAAAQVAVPPSVPLPAPVLAQRAESIRVDAMSLAGWTLDPRASRPPTVANGVLSLDDGAGWLRTRQTEFGTFTLRFAARVSSPKARAIVAILGTSFSGAESAFPIVLSADVPDVARWPSARLSWLLPDERLRRDAWSQEEWQHFELIRLTERVLLRLNDHIVLNIESPVTLDGWIGFRVQDGTLEFKDVTLGGAPPAAAPSFVRPGPGITLPVVKKEVKPNYTEEAMRRHIEGTAIIEMVVDVDGTVKRPVVVRFLDTVYGLDREALRAVSKWRFKPGLRAGTPVPVLVTVSMAFTLRN